MILLIVQNFCSIIHIEKRKHWLVYKTIDKKHTNNIDTIYQQLLSVCIPYNNIYYKLSII